MTTEDLKPFRNVRIKYKKSPKATTTKTTTTTTTTSTTEVATVTKNRKNNQNQQQHITESVHFAEQTILAKRVKTLMSGDNNNSSRLSLLESRFVASVREEDGGGGGGGGGGGSFCDFVSSNPMFNARKDGLGRRLAVSQRNELDADVLREFVCNIDV